MPATSSAPPAGRLTAEERRDAVIAAAIHEFARGGLAGTSTEAIARGAGVSQPYLFQLFGTKKELFIAVVRRCFERCTLEFQAAGRRARATGGTSNDILAAMGASYGSLLDDRDLLLIQLHAYAASDDPEIREIVRDEFARLHREVGRLSGAGDQALQQWFAYGMLCNVATAIGLPDVTEFPMRGPAAGGEADR
jgi:AcrR family transcriptional regulator